MFQGPLQFVKEWKTPCWTQNKTNNLLCLPGFYIIGFPKCATTDLWTRLMKHHQLKGWAKALHWWSRLRYRKYRLDKLSGLGNERQGTPTDCFVLGWLVRSDWPSVLSI
jgi:hypothetical protein